VVFIETAVPPPRGSSFISVGRSTFSALKSFALRNTAHRNTYSTTAAF
jgi:hypothetical protein